MSRYSLLIFCFIFSASLRAQINFNELHNQHAANTAARLMPSMLGSNSKNFDLTLFSVYANACNNFVSPYDLRRFAEPSSGGGLYVDEWLESTPAQSKVYVGTDIQLMNAAFTFRRKEKPFLHIAVGARQRNELLFEFDKNLLALFYRGNAQFAGQSVSLPPRLNFMSWLDYHAGIATQIRPGFLNGGVIKPAITVRRLVGIAAFNMPQANIQMYTSPDGRYIDLSSQFQVNVAPGVDSSNISAGFDVSQTRNFLRTGNGTGWGVDVGCSVELNKHFLFHAAVIDLGSIVYDDSSSVYTASGRVRYQGLEMSGLSNPTFTNPLQTDSLIRIFDPQEKAAPFTVRLPSKMIVGAQFQLGQDERNGVKYAAHTFSCFYVQGFSNALSATTKALFNVGYSFSLKNILNVGVNATQGAIPGTAIGAFASLNAGGFRISGGSNNLLPLFQDQAKGSDVFFQLGFGF